MKKHDRAVAHSELNLEEEMIGLYHNIENNLAENEKQVVQFISSHKDEGVTTISREFASVASKIFGKSVLVLDVGHTEKDKRLPPASAKDNKKDSHSSVKKSVSSQDDMTEKNSLNVKLKDHETDVLMKSLVKKDTIPYTLQPRNENGFYIGSLSELGASVSMIFSDKYFMKFLTLLKGRYDLVLIDTPPIGESTLGLAVAGKVDGVILVVEAETTRWPVIARLKEQVEKVGGTILGTVLNKQRYYIPKYIYNRFL